MAYLLIKISGDCCSMNGWFQRMFDVAIMQPTYLPWAGYFHLMSQVNFFVFLDDVQFSKSSWQSRNRINCFGDVQWISLPVTRQG
ncbi:WbqC family protein [Aliamphritea spongicola]